MTTEIVNDGQMVAGLLQAQCTCCAQAQQLIGHPDLDPSRLTCPVSQQVYLDRGDGLFEAEGQSLDQIRSGSGPDLTSDRPSRTGPKSRIQLERATFA